MFRIACGVMMAWLCAVGVQAAEVRVAVAANFIAPMQKLALSFQQETGHKVFLSLGSTGGFYAQIKHGAPFDILLAADDETPLKIEQEGLGVAGSRFTYATGQLVLWSKQAGWIDKQGDVLRHGQFQRIAMANPKLAPYGTAAVETLTALGLWSTVQPRLVLGDNIAQTYQFIATENAQLGFVAMSQVSVDGKILQGSAWIVPGHLYTPIRQDAVLLAKGRDNIAARALLTFLRSEKARAVIRASGYEL